MKKLNSFQMSELRAMAKTGIGGTMNPPKEEMYLFTFTENHKVTDKYDLLRFPFGRWIVPWCLGLESNLSLLTMRSLGPKRGENGLDWYSRALTVLEVAKKSRDASRA